MGKHQKNTPDPVTIEGMDALHVELMKLQAHYRVDVGNALDELQRLRDAWQAMLPYIKVSVYSKGTMMSIELKYMALCQIDKEDRKRRVNELVMEHLTNRKPK